MSPKHMHTSPEFEFMPLVSAQIRRGGNCYRNSEMLQSPGNSRLSAHCLSWLEWDFGNVGKAGVGGQSSMYSLGFHTYWWVSFTRFVFALSSPERWVNIFPLRTGLPFAIKIVSSPNYCSSGVMQNPCLWGSSCSISCGTWGKGDRCKPTDAHAACCTVSNKVLHLWQQSLILLCQHPWNRNRIMYELMSRIKPNSRPDTNM